MKIYAVEVESLITEETKVSQSGYSTLEKAQAFIKGRAGKVQEISPYLFYGEKYIYQIIEIDIQ